MTTELSDLLTDADNDTCLSVADVDLYAVDPSSSRWQPSPQHVCWLPGLRIDLGVSDSAATSFTVSVTGHHLTCSTSHFKVAMLQTRWRSEYDLAGEYRTCTWTDAVQSGQLTTCVAACRCDGNDCSHVIVHFPQKYQEWKICEIDIKPGITSR